MGTSCIKISDYFTCFCPFQKHIMWGRGLLLQCLGKPHMMFSTSVLYEILIIVHLRLIWGIHVGINFSMRSQGVTKLLLPSYRANIYVSFMTVHALFAMQACKQSWQNLAISWWHPTLCVGLPTYKLGKAWDLVSVANLGFSKEGFWFLK